MTTTTTTIQVRFADGSVDKSQFEVTDTVQDLFEWVASHKKVFYVILSLYRCDELYQII